MKLLLTFILVSFSFSGYSQEYWEKITEQNDVIHYYHKITSKRIGDTVILIRKVLYAKDKLSEEKEALKKLSTDKDFNNFSYTIIREEFDCKNRRSRITSTYHFDTSGNPIQNITIDKNSNEWKDIITESLQNHFLTLACLLKEKNKTEFKKD